MSPLNFTSFHALQGVWTSPPKIKVTLNHLKIYSIHVDLSTCLHILEIYMQLDRVICSNQPFKNNAHLRFAAVVYARTPSLKLLIKSQLSKHCGCLIMYLQRIIQYILKNMHGYIMCQHRPKANLLHVEGPVIWWTSDFDPFSSLMDFSFLRPFSSAYSGRCKATLQSSLKVIAPNSCYKYMETNTIRTYN